MKTDGGLAFPRVVRSKPDSLGVRGADIHYIHETAGGMSLRDWFAGHALTGLLADDDSVDRMTDMADNLGVHEVEAVVAVMAYKVADAMLAERTIR